MFAYYGLKTRKKNETIAKIMNRVVALGGSKENQAQRTEVFLQIAVASDALGDFDVGIKVKEFIHARIYSGYVKMVDDTEFTEVLGGVI